jgi:hypothetical protein
MTDNEAACFARAVALHLGIPTNLDGRLRAALTVPEDEGVAPFWAVAFRWGGREYAVSFDEAEAATAPGYAARVAGALRMAINFDEGRL